MNKKRALIVGTTGVWIIVVVIGLASYMNQKAQISELEQMNESLRLELYSNEDAYKVIVDDLQYEVGEKEGLMTELNATLDGHQDQIEELETEQKQLLAEIAALSGPDDLSIYKLERQGINDYTIIADDLYTKGAEVIGNEGVLGGTMHFTEVRILSDQWAYGMYEDGHIMGYGLYEYTVVGPETFEWKVILEYLD